MQHLGIRKFNMQSDYIALLAAWGICVTFGHGFVSPNTARKRCPDPSIWDSVPAGIWDLSFSAGKLVNPDDPIEHFPESAVPSFFTLCS